MMICSRSARRTMSTPQPRSPTLVTKLTFATNVLSGHVGDLSDLTFQSLGSCVSSFERCARQSKEKPLTKSPSLQSMGSNVREAALR